MTFNPNKQARAPDGKFSGGLVHSLEHQLREKGHAPPAAHQLAVEILTEQGSLHPTTGELTAKGQEREAMGRQGRRKDRVATQLGHDVKNIGYKGGRAYVK
jgi:hypothetical protein